MLKKNGLMRDAKTKEIQKDRSCRFLFYIKSIERLLNQYHNTVMYQWSVLISVEVKIPLSKIKDGQVPDIEAQLLKVITIYFIALKTNCNFYEFQANQVSSDFKFFFVTI